MSSLPLLRVHDSYTVFVSFLTNLLLNVVVVTLCLHYGSSKAKH